MNQNEQMQKKKMNIATAFRKWLLLLVALAFLATTAFLWVSQTKLAEHNAVNILSLNIHDVNADIHDASDENLLNLAYQIADELNKADGITDGMLVQIAQRYDVTEINYIDREGIIRATTYSDFLNYDMAGGEQSAAFLVLLDGENEYVQSYGPVSYDASISRKYGGVALANGGFVQIGYDADRFQKDISKNVIGVTRNRHVGKEGFLIIADENGVIVSDRNGGEGKHLDTTGILQDNAALLAGEQFKTKVYGQRSYCMYQEAEGYQIIAVMPQSEVLMSRNMAVLITVLMEMLVFAALFRTTFILVRRLVVDNIHQINDSLSEITGGNLETVVDVCSHVEFEELSNDINATVNTLKKYIADEAARIDTELAFAKAIQHSALPSTFPPYPNRKDFDIWAAMHTAKEVGGDFYDFYFINNHKLAFLIADVSGKGIPAAMFMMTAKALLKSYAEARMSVEEVFYNANNKLCEGNDAGMFVTAWMGILDTKTGEVTFANAGHNPPVVRHADGEFAYMKTRAGFVLAGMEDFPYTAQTLQLEPGDTIYLYTDGITEATDANNVLDGEDRLLELLNCHKDANAETVCRVVKEDVDAFVGVAPQFDDITMLCLKYNGV